MSLGVAAAGSDGSRGKPAASWTMRHHGQSQLHSDEQETTFFLRICLVVAKDVVPEESAATRSHLVPHIIHVSTALWRGVHPDTGELYLRLPPDPTAKESDVGATLPICTTKHLCEVQRLALALPAQPPSIAKAQFPMRRGEVERELNAPELPRYKKSLHTKSDPELLGTS